MVRRRSKYCTDRDIVAAQGRLCRAKTYRRTITFLSLSSQRRVTNEDEEAIGAKSQLRGVQIRASTVLSVELNANVTTSKIPVEGV